MKLADDLKKRWRRHELDALWYGIELSRNDAHCHSFLVGISEGNDLSWWLLFRLFGNIARGGRDVVVLFDWWVVGKRRCRWYFGPLHACAWCSIIGIFQGVINFVDFMSKRGCFPAKWLARIKLFVASSGWNNRIFRKHRNQGWTVSLSRKLNPSFIGVSDDDNLSTLNVCRRRQCISEIGMSFGIEIFETCICIPTMVRHIGFVRETCWVLLPGGRCGAKIQSLLWTLKP